MKRKHFIFALVAMLLSFVPPAFAQVAKVGNTEYATIDEAIAAWSNNSTLTLLDNVTLSDVIKLSSTEYHILDLGTYTMTAASKKDAIQIVNNGRSSASYALDIKADASNPGGITATGKAVVKTTGKSGVKDRPIIRFYNGVFTGSNVVSHSGSNGTNCPQFWFYGGEFYGTISANRAKFIFYGGTFNGSIYISVDSNADALVVGGTFKQLSNLYGSTLNTDKFTIGSAAGVYDKEVYIDDNGYYVIAASEPSEGFEASVAKTPGTNDYLAYSKVATEGLKYTDVKAALNNNSSATVTVYVDELDMEGINFKGTIVVPEGKTVKITNAPEGLKTEGNAVIVKPVAKIGDVEYMSLEEAFAAATEGQTIILMADATPALASQRAITKAAVIDLGGKTMTLKEDDLYFGTTTFKNGTIVVDPSVKPSTAVFWMFANQTLTFDKVKVVATGVTGTYLIGLDGNNSDLNLLNGSEILVENTTALDLDIICVNATTGNDIKVENSKVNVTNLDGRVFFRGNYTVNNSEVNLSGITKAGFRIEAGQKLSIEGTSKVNIEGEPRDGGIHMTDLSATYTKAETATVNATVNEPKVAKVGENTYRTLAQAVAAVEDGGTITLIANETFTKNNRYNNGGYWDGLGYSGDKSFTIDLANFTISQDGALNDYLMWFKNDGAKGNTITLKNGTLDAGTTAYSALATSSSNAQKITVNLENINVINNNSNGAALKIRGGSELNVKAGTIITGQNSYLGIETVGKTTVVNIYEGAEIYQNGTSSYCGCLAGASGNGTINVYGGKGQSKSGGFIAMTSGGTINIEGGEWTANTDGTYANGNKSVLVAQSDKQYNAGAGNSIVNVTGGTFKGGYNCYGNKVGDAQINIKGGNFNANPTSYVADGYVAVENNGVWNVEKAAAKIGTTAYATFAEAITAAQAGDVVNVFAGTYKVPTMKAGITIEGEVDSEGKSTVLLEGTLSGTLENLTLKNLHIKGGNAQRWAYANGNLVFENVTFEATSVYAIHFDGITEGATLTYKNCTIIGWAALGGSPKSCKFEGCTIKDNGTYGVIRTYFDTEIKDCTFDVANAKTDDVYQDGIHAVGSAKVAVNGCTNANGEMKDLVNVSGASVVTVDGVEIKNVAKIGETYYATLAEAIAASTPETGWGGEVTLLKDITLEGGYADAGEGLRIEKSVTINGAGYTIDCGTFKKGIRIYQNGDQASNVMFKDVNIVNNNYQGRCIDTRSGKINLMLNGGVNLTAHGVNSQPLTIGGSEAMTKVTINGGTIDAGTSGYAVICFVPVTNHINVQGNAVIKGLAAFYLKEGVNNTAIKLSQSTCIGTNKNVSASGAFGAVVIEGSNNAVRLEHSGAVVKAVAGNGAEMAPQAAFLFRGNNNTVGYYNNAEPQVITEGGQSYFVMANANVTGTKFVKNSVEMDPEAATRGYQFMTIEDALRFADGGSTVKLLADVTLSETYVNNKTLTIDLNGKTLSTALADGSTTNHLYAIHNYGELTITDSSDAKDGKISARGIFNYGAMTLTSGTINAIDGNGGYGVRNYAGATFTMNGGTIATTLEDDNKVDKGGYDASPVRVDEDATFTMNGGVINNICDFTVAIDNYGTTIINDGKATTVHTTLANSGTMTINGGEFTCNGLEGVTAHVLWATDGSTTTINGGTFDGKDNYNGFNVDASKGANVVIKGGNFRSVHSGSLYGDGTITVSGGTFFDKISDQRCELGFQAVVNTEGTYDVKRTGIRDAYTIVDGQMTEFVNEKDIEVGTLTYKRTFKNTGKWQTLYVPFEIPVNELIDNGYSVAYVNDVQALDRDEDGDVEHTEMTVEYVYLKNGILKANHPYVIKPLNDAAKTMELVLNDAKLYGTSAENQTAIDISTAYVKFDFKGTLSKTPADELGSNVFSLNNSGIWQKLGSTVNLGAFRVYFTMENKNGSPIIIPEGAEIRSRVVGEKDEATGIITPIVDGDVRVNDGTIFDLMGRPVRTPEKGKIYIMNGKKVLF